MSDQETPVSPPKMRRATRKVRTADSVPSAPPAPPAPPSPLASPPIAADSVNQVKEVLSDVESVVPVAEVETKTVVSEIPDDELVCVCAVHDWPVYHPYQKIRVTKLKSAYMKLDKWTRGQLRAGVLVISE